MKKIIKMMSLLVILLGIITLSGCIKKEDPEDQVKEVFNSNVTSFNNSYDVSKEEILQLEDLKNETPSKYRMYSNLYFDIKERKEYELKSFSFSFINNSDFITSITVWSYNENALGNWDVLYEYSPSVTPSGWNFNISINDSYLLSPENTKKDRNNSIRISINYYNSSSDTGPIGDVYNKYKEEIEAADKNFGIAIYNLKYDIVER